MVPAVILPEETGTSSYDDDDYYVTSYGYEPAGYAYGATDSRKSNSKISYARNSLGSKSGKSNANGGQAAGSYYSYYSSPYYGPSYYGGGQYASRSGQYGSRSGQYGSRSGQYGSRSDQYGSHSGHGGCCCNSGSSDNALRLGAAFLACLAITQCRDQIQNLINQLNGNGRKRRSVDDDDTTKGIESFEEKIGSFASADVDSNPDSWLNAAFQKIGVNVDDIEGKEGNLKKEKEDEGDDEKGQLDLNGNKIGEGLENPALEDPATEARYKRSAADLEAIAEEEAAANEIFGGKDGDDCQAKYMRCLASAFKSGVENVGSPGGITDALKRNLSKLAFSFKRSGGGFWNSLMEIPEARIVQRCSVKHSECASLEILKREVAAGGGDASLRNRLIIVPEEIEGKDESDGSTEFGERE